MFRNPFPNLTPLALPIRVLSVLLRFILISTTFVIGCGFFPLETDAGPIFWTVWICVSAALIAMGPVRSAFERWRFARLIRHSFVDAGADRHALINAANQIRTSRELTALETIRRLGPAPENSARSQGRAFIASLAGARWLLRQSPFETLPQRLEGYPQIHALTHFQPVARAPLRNKALRAELDRITSRELDDYARSFTTLVDALLLALDNPAAPFHSEAPDLLAMLTGRAHLLHANERMAAWWAQIKPVYLRGGGALLAGTRLLQRGAFQEAAHLLERLAQDGMLSHEADTLRRASRFLALFSQPQWHMTSADIPRYFSEGLYHQWEEMGVFRFPTADLGEVISCCRRGKIYRDAKRRLIEDTLDVWERVGEDLSEPLMLLLRRLLEERGRHLSARPDFWRLKWEVRKRNFDQDVELLMNGIVAAAKHDWAAAAVAFDAAAALDTSSSLPLVNKVCIQLKSGKKNDARKLIEHIQILHPKDGQAMISMGRLLAIHLEDTVESEKLFKKALSLVNPPTEALSCLGEVRMLAGDFNESQYYFEQARQLDPSLPGPKLGLARVLVEMHRFTDAIEVLKEVARDGPAEARDVAYYMLYRTHREAGEDRVSLKYLEMIPARFFNDPDTIDDIAVHLESEKMYAKAREFAERAMLLRSTGKGRNEDSDALGV